jgi:hypothetical protein
MCSFQKTYTELRQTHLNGLAAAIVHQKHPHLVKPENSECQPSQPSH